MPLRLNTHLNPLHLYLMDRLGQDQKRRNALKKAKRLEARFIGRINQQRGCLGCLIYDDLSILSVLRDVMKSIQLYTNCNQFQKAVSLCIKTQKCRCWGDYKTSCYSKDKDEQITIFNKIQSLYFLNMDKMSHEQRVKYCSILIDIYEKAITDESCKLRSLYKKFIQFLRAKNIDQFNSNTHEKIMTAYLKLLKLHCNQWEEMIDYIINIQPDKSEILKFCKIYRNGAGFQNGLLYLLLEESEKAWDSAQLLRKSNMIDQYKQLSTILAYFDLSHSHQLRSYSKLSQKYSYGLGEIANRLQRKQKKQSQEQQIRRHEERIQFYRSNNHLLSLEIANNSLLKIIHLSDNIKDSHKRCVQIYQELMEINRKQPTKLEAIYLKLLRLQVAQLSPDYQFLLDMRKKNFSKLSFKDALLLLCLKEYGKVSKLIAFWGIEGEMKGERKNLGEALRLMQEKDVEGLKKHFCLYDTGSLDFIEALKATLIRILEIELENSSSEAEVLIDIEK